MKEKGIRLYGVVIIVLITLLFLGEYYLLVEYFGLGVWRSVSFYVTMDDSYFFGILLTIPSMLFIFNGFVYWKRPEVRIGQWGTWLASFSVAAGFCLLMVALIHCVKYHGPHMFFAVAFFAFCALMCFGENREERKEHWFAFSVMALGFLVPGGNYLGWWSIYPDTLNIFAAEAISLWVTGTTFILASLDRVQAPAAQLKPALSE